MATWARGHLPIWFTCRMWPLAATPANSCQYPRTKTPQSTAGGDVRSSTAMARHSHGHIAQCLGGILARRGTATVAVDSGGGRRLSGAEFADGVRRLAAGLAGRGVRPGDVVAVVAFNR